MRYADQFKANRRQYGLIPSLLHHYGIRSVDGYKPIRDDSVDLERPIGPLIIIGMMLYGLLVADIDMTEREMLLTVIFFLLGAFAARFRDAYSCLRDSFRVGTIIVVGLCLIAALFLVLSTASRAPLVE